MSNLSSVRKIGSVSEILGILFLLGNLFVVIKVCMSVSGIFNQLTYSLIFTIIYWLILLFIPRPR